MYLLYLDASGTVDLSDTGSKHYVLIGTAIKESNWNDIHRNFVTIVEKYSYPGLPFEVHVKDFHCPIREQDEIPDFERLTRVERRSRILEIRQSKNALEKPNPKKLREQRATDPYVHLTRLERTRLLDDVIDMISSSQSIKLFGDAITKSHPAVTEKRIDPNREAFTQLCTRFDYFLHAIGPGRFPPTPNRYIHKGLLIFDQEPTCEKIFIPLMNEYRGIGHPYGTIRHVIDVPFFAKSQDVVGLRNADVCAFVTRKYLDTINQPNANEANATRFRKLFRFFDRNAQGDLHGLRHYIPAADQCRCLICLERNR
jgi:hypothetical protein